MIINKMRTVKNIAVFFIEFTFQYFEQCNNPKYHYLVELGNNHNTKLECYLS